jgi:hypothetical protein
VLRSRAPPSSANGSGGKATLWPVQRGDQPFVDVTTMPAIRARVVVQELGAVFVN